MRMGGWWWLTAAVALVCLLPDGSESSQLGEGCFAGPHPKRACENDCGDLGTCFPSTEATVGVWCCRRCGWGCGGLIAGLLLLLMILCCAGWFCSCLSPRAPREASQPAVVHQNTGPTPPPQPLPYPTDASSA